MGVGRFLLLEEPERVMWSPVKEAQVQLDIHGERPVSCSGEWPPHFRAKGWDEPPCLGPSHLYHSIPNLDPHLFPHGAGHTRMLNKPNLDTHRGIWTLLAWALPPRVPVDRIT